MSNFEYHRDLRIPVDTETVGGRRLSPEDGDDAHPVLLVYTPYRVHDRAFGLHSPVGEYLAERGYEVVFADMVGTGASTGYKAEPFEPAEGEEAATIVEWLADREWSTGRVGMFGLSYPGITALAAATKDPDGLEAIVPIHAPYTGFQDNYIGGAFQLYLRGGHWPPMMQALQSLPPSYRDADGRWARIWEERLDGLRSGEPWLFQFLEHDRMDDYWNGRDLAVEAIDTPTLAVAGYRDRYPPTTVEYFEAVSAPKQLVLGPWGHVMPPEGSVAPIDFYRQMDDWFDRFLREGDGDESRAGDPDTDVGNTVVYWTGRPDGAATDAGTWRETGRWPTVAGTDRVGEWDRLSFALTSDGLDRANGYEFGEFHRTYELDHTVGAESADRFVGSGVDTAVDDARSLTVETEPLSDPVELTGTPEACITVKSTNRDPSIAIRVVDVAPDGSARQVTRGQLRLSHRDSLSDPAELQPGEMTAVTLPLKPASHVFESGHRLRVALSGGLFPETLPARDHGSFSIRSTPENPSHLSFPGRVHKGGVSFPDSTAMDPPTPGYTEPPREGTWTVKREHLADAVTVESTSAYRLPLGHADFDYVETIEAHVDATNPRSAAISNDLDIALNYGDETVRTQVQTRVAHDTAQVRTAVELDDQSVFDERWRWTR